MNCGGFYVVEKMERETGIEPATNSLEGCDSTIELLPRPLHDCDERPLLLYGAMAPEPRPGALATFRTTAQTFRITLNGMVYLCRRRATPPNPWERARSSIGRASDS